MGVNQVEGPPDYRYRHQAFLRRDLLLTVAVLSYQNLPMKVILDSPAQTPSDTGLESLKLRMRRMSDRAQFLVDLALDALLKRDGTKARAVIRGDREIDALSVEVQELAMDLLAAQPSTSNDVRFILGAIKISSDLERAGDHAVTIAESALRLLARHAAITPGPELKDMAFRSRHMLADALDAFMRSDAALGRQVRVADDQVNAIHDRLSRNLLAHVSGDPHTISAGMELFLVSRSLERVANLATNIGENATYLDARETVFPMHDPRVS